MFYPPKTADFIIAPVDADPDSRVSADFVCDGENDAELFQTALDKLPERGGKIYVVGGTLNLKAQIRRDINNVTVEGAGRATRINLNGETPVISAGERAGWSLVNFDTDAGGVDVLSATEAYVGYWRAGVRVFSVVSDGLESTPPPGNRRVVNLFVTPSGKLQIDFDETPV